MKGIRKVELPCLEFFSRSYGNQLSALFLAIVKNKRSNMKQVGNEGKKKKKKTAKCLPMHMIMWTTKDEL